VLPVSALLYELRDSRREARELADNLAVMLRDVLELGLDPELPGDTYQAAETLLQEWHERSWSPIP
jgi:hypothetical protein